MRTLRSIITLILLFFVSANLNSQSLWMRYASISPDGTEIAFSYKGDLFRVSSSGGIAIPLSIHKAHDWKPVWSPDGKHIAFASNRYGNFDIYLIPSEGGTAKRLTFFSGNETPSSFTPDGKEVLFSASINDHPNNVMFPSPILTELYSVPVDGERVKQVLTTPALNAAYNKGKEHILYYDIKGYEDKWRKHHTSSVTRDIWIYETAGKKHKKLTEFKGEDRCPVFAAGEKGIYYLSEESGSFNVHSMKLSEPGKSKQRSHFDKHPVRFLTVSNNDLLCYTWNGEIYTQEPEKEPVKINVEIKLDSKGKDTEYLKLGKGAKGMAVSPNGKEVAFILRGEVFVTSTEYNSTRRITNTPEQERSLNFSPDGKKLVYASERKGSWNLYISKIEGEEDNYFTSARLIKEDPLLETENECFQPTFSPDGKEVAYLENRTSLKVINLKDRETRLILPGELNYSYSDGDQWYRWSPNGEWFLASYSPHSWILNDVALVKADGSGEIYNLTKSGYSDGAPKWAMKGNAVLWFTDRNGYRSHGSWGSEYDAYAMFLNRKAFDRFRLSKEEFELQQEKEKKETANKKKKDKKKDKAKEVKFDLEGTEDRIARLTIHSSFLSDAVLSPAGDKLYYLSKFEKGYDLWMNDLRKKETKLVLKLNGGGGSIVADSAFKNLYVFAGGQMMKIETAGNKKKNISYSAELLLDRQKEREYMFEHVWRQVKRKWYDSTLHGVDWDFYKAEYSRFLPHINNNFDFADMLGEMLGELNGSHTGGRYHFSDPSGDKTAKLGALFADNFQGDGLKITEILDKGPLTKDGTKIGQGVIIEKIDNREITSGTNYFSLLNHKEGKQVLLSLYDPDKKKRWEETVKPISTVTENQLLYERWVKQRKKETDRLSGGRIGYVHIRGMNSSSYRTAYSEILGRNHDKEAIIVDTRFNGGGWLHDDLATLLNGKRYADYYPGGRYHGSEPIAKWDKPSIVLMSESNYSDAHGFPYVYKTLGIGKLVGMPVPGTMTAVWWESLQDNTLIFGIPQVGTKDMKGNFLENQQLEPDYKVPTNYEIVVTGRDQQLEKAVEVLLKEL